MWNEGEVERMSCYREFRVDGGAVQAFACLASTITSLPTVIIEGQELDLDSYEADYRLVAEYNGNTDTTQLIDFIADNLATSQEQVVSYMAKLDANGENITVEKVIKGLEQ